MCMFLYKYVAKVEVLINKKINKINHFNKTEIKNLKGYRKTQFFSNISKT